MERVRSLLEQALEAHGVAAVHAGGSFRLEHGLVLTPLLHEIRAEPEPYVVSLEVLVDSPLLSGRTISEQFAGSGESRDQAVFDAFSKFLLGTFHVLLEALGGHVCDEPQAEIERWEGPSGSWNVYSGPVLAQYSTESVLFPVYTSGLSLLQQAFSGAQPGEPHWLRVFLASYHGQIQTAEVLLDNEPWPAGLDALDQLQWAVSDEYQALRHFAVALQANG